MPRQEEKAQDFVKFFIGEKYYNLNLPTFVASSYILPGLMGWKVIREEREDEISDEEILKYIEQSESFSFLNDPEEDIYGLDDGEPV